MAHLEEELLAGHLEGLLDDDVARVVHNHLTTCDDCLERLAELRALLALLPGSLDELAPRSEVKGRLLAAAAADPGIRPAPLPIEPRRLPAKRRRVWLPVLAIAASILVAGVVGALAWSILGTRSDADRGLLQAITGTDKGTVLPMNGTDVAPNVRAALLAPEGVDRVYVVVSNVPQPPAGQNYQLYLYEAGQPIAAAVLQPDARGRINAVLDAPLARFDAMEVDLQPIGSTAPGGPAVLKSQLP